MKEIWRRLSVDWRARVILYAIAVSLVGTAYIYSLNLSTDIGLNPTTHFGAVFAAWVGGLALFVTAGALVAFVSLARPEQEPFEARARILLGGKTGPHIDHMIKQLAEKFEHLSENESKTVRLLSHNEEPSAYRVIVTAKTRICSYIDDVDTTYNSKVQYKDMTAAPPGTTKRNRLVSFEVAGNPVGSEEYFETGFERSFVANIKRNSWCDIETKVEFWIEATKEPNTNLTKRFTKSLRLDVENAIDPARPVRIKICSHGKNRDEFFDIPHGKTQTICLRRDLAPDVEAYKFWILEP